MRQPTFVATTAALSAAALTLALEVRSSRATAGSDFPWCGKGPSGPAQIGNARFYTKVEEPLTFERWRESLKAGHTFVSSGPVLELTVNGMLPGDSLDVAKGTRLRIAARADGHPDQMPLRELEIVGHQKILRRVVATDPAQSPAEIQLDLELPVEHGLWIAARCRAGDLQVAHTTPVYVTVDGGGFENPDTAGHYLDLGERYLRELDRPVESVSRQAWRYRQGLLARIAETRRVIAELQARFPKPVNPDPGPLLALPTLRDGWEMAAEGRITEALAAYARAERLDPGLRPSTAAWSTLCWGGAVRGHGGDVMRACDRGLELAPDDVRLHEGRAIARALAGDLDGARDDLESLKAADLHGSARWDVWIEALRRGENPFTPEVRESLQGR